MTRVRTQDASTALTTILSEQAKAAAGNNSQISKTEEQALTPVLQRAATALRDEGGRGTRVTVDAVVARATTDSMAVWGRFNANNQGRDGAWLSSDEVKDMARADPALGALTEQALLRVRRGSTPTPGPTTTLDPARAASYLAAINVDNGLELKNANRLDIRSWHAFTAPTRATVPAPILAAFDHYARAEEADWAGVKLEKGEIDGKPVYGITMSTDGDDKYYELFDDKGQGLASSRGFSDGVIYPDPFFGRARLSPSIRRLDGPDAEEGLSEPIDRAAAGQPPQGWRGDVVVDSGAFHFDQFRRLERYELPAGLVLSAPQQELLYAGLDLVADRVMQHRVTPGQPLEVGPLRNGTLAIGSFTRPTDGETYEVAAWKDIDDSSFVFYFQRDAGQLRLRIEQFDN
jgi:hypothetical protein